MHRLRLAAAAAFTLAVVAAAPAQASTVSLTPNGDAGYALRFDADQGERNDVNISTLGTSVAGGWLVYDAAALTAGPGCRSLDAHTASCPLTETDKRLLVLVELRDGDDTASVADACGAAGISEDAACQPATVDGGTGNDVIYGSDVKGEGSDVGSYIMAGDGDDVVFAGRAPAHIDGELGDDVIYGSPGPDRLSGGGDGEDRIYGYGGDDHLWGGFRSDRLDGGSGNDTISGGTGRDRLIGGSGNDTFYAFDHWRDRVEGGHGSDRATIDGGRDRTASLERIRRRD